MNKNVKVILITVIGAILVIGIGVGAVFGVKAVMDSGDKKQAKEEKKDKKEKKDKNDKKNKYNADNIGFVYVASNYAWGSYFSGYYVDVDGSVYEFDFSDDDFFDISVERAVTDHNKTASRTISKGDMKSLQKKVARIDDDMKLDAYGYAMDMGEKTIYAVIFEDDGQFEIIRLGAYGDNIYVPDSRDIRDVCKYFKIDISAAKGMKASGYLKMDGTYVQY